jgi:ribosomal-protein-alanine N-acetyltransferase
MSSLAVMRVRRATLADLDRIFEIERCSFSAPWPREYLAQHLGDDGFVVVEYGNLVVGYAVVGIKIPSFWARLEQRTRARLLEYALDYCRQLGAERVELEVRTGQRALPSRSIRSTAL